MNETKVIRRRVDPLLVAIETVERITPGQSYSDIKYRCDQLCRESRKAMVEIERLRKKNGMRKRELKKLNNAMIKKSYVLMKHGLTDEHHLVANPMVEAMTTRDPDTVL